MDFCTWSGEGERPSTSNMLARMVSLSSLDPADDFIAEEMNTNVKDYFKAKSHIEPLEM